MAHTGLSLVRNGKRAQFHNTNKAVARSNVNVEEEAPYKLDSVRVTTIHTCFLMVYVNMPVKLSL